VTQEKSIILCIILFKHIIVTWFLSTRLFHWLWARMCG